MRISDRKKGYVVLCGMTIACLLLAEIVLRLFGYGAPETREDPFLGFEGTNRAFQVVGDSYCPVPNKPDLKQCFAVRKPANGYRVFTFGGSTTYGTPFGNEGSYPHYLQQILSELYPDKTFEVINLGVPGFGSRRVLQLFEEAIDYEPDLFVVWNGQNEMRDATFHPWELRRGPFRVALMSSLFSSRLFYLVHQAMQAALSAVLGERQVSYGGAQVADILSKPFGADTFKSYDLFAVPSAVVAEPAPQHEEDSRSLLDSGKQMIKVILERGYLEIPLPEVVEIFSDTTSKMIDIAASSDIDIVFLQPAYNPKNRSALSPHVFRVPASLPWDRDLEGRVIATYVAGIRSWEAEDYAGALEEFENVSRLLGGSDGNLLRLYKGMCYEKLGNTTLASAEYESRTPADFQALNAALDAITSKFGVPVIDVLDELKAASDTGMVGYENYFVDAVHLTREGYRVVALAVARLIYEGEYVPNGGLEDRAQRDDGVWNQDLLGEASKAVETAESNTALAWAAFQNDDLNLSLEMARRALELDPEEIQAHLLLGYLYARLGRLEDAEVAYDTLDRLYRASR